ncbi:hypothetical protein [Aliidiomarina celeris]|uniref:hypothetical protein n=1 Tax=Aliidiomarina celeris TaxID=2249428 RepID=UPI000DEA19A9|nr:hypothetical protein [Aliidiomarina celeris]
MKQSCSIQSCRKGKGQALVELALALSVVGLVVLLALPNFHQRLTERARAHEQAQLLIEQAPMRADRNLAAQDFESISALYEYPEWEKPNLDAQHNDDYSFAKLISPVWSVLELQGNFSLPTGNLYQLRAYWPGDNDQEQNWFNYVRLDNDWSPRRIAHLNQRPRSLTLTSYLNDLGVDYLQQWVSILPFAREFAPHMLVLGHVDNQPVPTPALCKPAECGHD